MRIGKYVMKWEFKATAQNTTGIKKLNAISP